MPLHPLLHRLTPDAPDRELLERYVRDRDEQAFAALVARHGRMVRAVCRRVLGHDADADDATQAALLVFARKAAGIRDRNGLANWLFGVAHRVAVKARQTRSRRQAKEKRTPPRPPEQVTTDFAELLQAELAKLPAAYRAAVLLCDLEGQTIAEAAKQLGIPPGTVASRLARGRTRLANRLRALGLGVSAGLVATWFTETTQAAVRFDDDPPAHVLTLAEEAMRSTFTTPTFVKLTVLFGVLAVAGVPTAMLAGAAPARDGHPIKAPVPKTLKGQAADGVPAELLGTWSLHLDSMKRLDAGLYVTFHGDGTVTRWDPGTGRVGESGRYSVDVTADPPQFRYDLSARERQSIPLPTDTPFVGSFKLDGDQLTLTLSDDLRPLLNEKHIKRSVYDLEYRRVDRALADELKQIAADGQGQPPKADPPAAPKKGEPKLDPPKGFAPFFILSQALVERDGDDKLKVWIKVPVGRFLKLTDAKGRAVHVHDSSHPEFGPVSMPVEDLKLFDIAGNEKSKADWKALFKDRTRVLYAVEGMYDLKTLRTEFAGFLKDDVLVLVVPKAIDEKIDKFKNLPEIESLPQVFPGQPAKPNDPVPPKKP